MGERGDDINTGVGEDPKAMSCRDCPAERPAYYAAALRHLAVDNPAWAHARADEILMLALPDEVREAYEDLVARAPWWACA